MFFLFATGIKAAAFNTSSTKPYSTRHLIIVYITGEMPGIVRSGIKNCTIEIGTTAANPSRIIKRILTGFNLFTTEKTITAAIKGKKHIITGSINCKNIRIRYCKD